MRPSEIRFSAAYWALAALLSRFHSFPLNDDWAYSATVENWMRSGVLRLSNWGSPTLLFQVWWGRLFCLPFGFSFDALRLSTLVLGWAGLLAFHRTLRRLGGSEPACWAGAAALLLNPLFFVLDYSFMTDVPALSLMLLAGWAFVEGLETDRDAWFALGGTFSACAYLIKQTGPAMALTVAAWLLLRPKPVRAARLLLVLGLPILTVLGHALWMRSAGPTFAFRHYLISATLAHLSDPAAFLKDALSRLSGASLYAGMFLFPWALASPAKTKERSWGGVLALAAVWLAGYLLGAAPLTGNTIGRFGLGTCPFGADCHFKAAGIFGELFFWKIVTATAPFCLALLLVRIPFGKGDWASTRGAYISGFLLAFAMSLAGRDYFDRYYLLLFPALIAWLAVGREPRPRYFFPALSLLGAWCLLGTWDCLAWNQARWLAGERLRSSGIPSREIENGIDWDAYHGYEESMRALLGKRPPESLAWDAWMESSHFRAFVSFSPTARSANRHPFGQESYWSPLSRRNEFFYLWKS